ncbi:ABC transporter ATP-binding protein [Thalassotalea fusca]
MHNYIALDNLSQSFETSEQPVTLFNNINLSINQGQTYAITGPSGVGKSSLLMLMAGLEQGSSGHVWYVEQGRRQSIEALKPYTGFIFQQFHLLPELTALHNVALPLKLRGDKQALEKAKLWLDKVHLSHRANHKPSQLSGGEQQRVAIARALVFSPKFIFADEPTGNLDQKNANEIADLLFACCQENDAGLIMVTHSDSLASRAEHVYALNDRELIAEHKSAGITTAREAIC